EDVGEVGEERALLQAAGDGRREQPLDGAFALVCLAAEGELAVDDGAAEAAFGVVVGWLDAVGVGEGPECGPAVEEVVGELAVVLRPRAFPGGVLEELAEFLLERRGLRLQPGPVGVCLVAGPGGEELARDAQALVAELLLFGHAFAVGGEVPEQMRPAELPLGGVEVVVAAPA